MGSGHCSKLKGKICARLREGEGSSKTILSPPSISVRVRVECRFLSPHSEPLQVDGKGKHPGRKVATSTDLRIARYHQNLVARGDH